ncbi:MAG: hypothetical protein U0521_09030 [Anaerolineae bacterium]
MLTFGVAGMSAVIFSLVIVRSGELPKALGYLGYLLGVLLLVVYLGRPIGLTRPIWRLSSRRC